MLRLLTYASAGEVRLGAQVDDLVVDLNRANPSLPNNLQDLILDGPRALDLAQSAADQQAAAYRANADALKRSGKVQPLADVSLLAPLPAPRRNVFCVGRNYLKHLIEGLISRGQDPKDPRNVPQFPEYFTKAPSSVVGQNALFPLDPGITEKLDYEVELALIVGRRGANIPLESAYDYVFGYTVGNDITARDLQSRHGQWFKGKSLDHSCPLGPVVIPHRDLGDPHNLGLRLRLNGETMQESNTGEMTYKIPQLLHFLSLSMTLEPGDIILTGTPDGVGNARTPPVRLKAGDVLEAEVDSIGTLRTCVVEA